MNPSNDYPESVSEVLDDSMTFEPAALAAVKVFARSKPWAGTLDERHQKFGKLYAALADAYQIQPPRLIFGNDHQTCSGKSGYIPPLRTVVLRGRLSVVTALHEFCHVRGMDERQACRWSINIFRRCFPKSWSRVTFDGHMIRSA